MDALERRLEDLTHTVQVLVTNNTQVTTPGNGQIVGQREVADGRCEASSGPKDRQDIPQDTPSSGPVSTVTNLPKSPARLPDLIQKAKKMNAEGASWAEIARRWNASGIPTLSGKGQWHRKTVARMVENK